MRVDGAMTFAFNDPRDDVHACFNTFSVSCDNWMHVLLVSPPG